MKKETNGTDLRENIAAPYGLDFLFLKCKLSR